MTVFINNKEIAIFEGATVGNAVLAYSLRSYKMLMSGKLCVFDRFGNITNHDGAVIDGQKLFLKRNIFDIWKFPEIY